jgi:hypothetical protein
MAQRGARRRNQADSDGDGVMLGSVLIYAVALIVLAFTLGMWFLP